MLRRSVTQVVTTRSAFQPLLSNASNTLTARQYSTLSQEDEQKQIAYHNLPTIISSQVISPLRTVPQAYFALVEQFSKYQTQLDPGLNVLIPFVHRLIFVSKSENLYAVTRQNVITKDNSSVTADGVFYFRVIDPIKAVYGVRNLNESLVNLVVTNLRAVMGNMELDEIIGGRKLINAKVEEVVKPVVEQWGVVITRVEVKTITPDPKLVVAMDQQMIAEREKRSAILSAEGKRQAMILDAEGKQLAAIRQAEGDLKVAELEAQARRITAEAEAAALQAIGRATGHDPATFTIAKETARASQLLATSTNKTFVLNGASNFFAPLMAAKEMLGINAGNEEAPSAPKVKQ